MAKRLEVFPSFRSEPRYPWDEWLDGSVWELEQGRDFTSKVPTFRANAQTQARKRGGAIRTRLLDNGQVAHLVIQFRRR
jgi:hypothetical protein